jgi:class 3 adenylate cyclase
MALHWGPVRIGSDGDVLGVEVHRLSRLEGVQIQDQVESVAYEEALPKDDRILITKQGFERLDDSDQARFRPAGTFRLESFDEFCELWVLHKATSVH